MLNISEKNLDDALQNCLDQFDDGDEENLSINKEISKIKTMNE